MNVSHSIDHDTEMAVSLSSSINYKYKIKASVYKFFWSILIFVIQKLF